MHDDEPMKDERRRLTLADRVEKLEAICQEQEHHLQVLRAAMRRVIEYESEGKDPTAVPRYG